MVLKEGVKVVIGKETWLETDDGSYLGYTGRLWESEKVNWFSY